MQQPHSSAQYTAVWLLCIYPLTAPNSSAKTSRREIKTLVLMSISISILASYTNPALLFRLLRCKQPAWSTRDWINVKYDSKKWKQIKNIKLKYGLRGGTIFFFLQNIKTMSLKKKGLSTSFLAFVPEGNKHKNKRQRQWLVLKKSLFYTSRFLACSSNLQQIMKKKIRIKSQVVSCTLSHQNPWETNHQWENIQEPFRFWTRY